MVRSDDRRGAQRKSRQRIHRVTVADYDAAVELFYERHWMIIILPILFPLVTGLSFDPIWFGISMVVWLEIGLITPPVGLNGLPDVPVQRAS